MLILARYNLTIIDHAKKARRMDKHITLGI